MKRFLTVLVLSALLVTTLAPGMVMAATKISLTEAIQMAKSAFPKLAFPSEFSSSYRENDEQGLWYLSWRSSGDKMSEVNITVDGTTGEITSFSSYVEPDPNVQYAPLPKLTQEQSKALAEAFLGGLIPEKFAQCQYSEQEPPRPYFNQRNWRQTYNFQFIRQVNGIPVPANQIAVSVDGDSGEITAYSLQWNDLEFPSTEQILTPEQAGKVLAEHGELELQYFWPSVERGQTAKPILAYSYPNINSVYIDAHTGELHNDGYIIYRGAADSGKTYEVASTANTLTPEEQAEVEYVNGLLNQEQAEAKARELLSLPAGLLLTRASLTQDYSFPDLRTWQLRFYSAEQDESYQISLDAKTGELYGVNHYWPDKSDLQVGSLTPEQASQVAEAFMQKYNPGKADQVELQTMPTRPEDGKDSLYYSFNYRRMVNDIPFVSNYITVTVKGERGGLVTDYAVRWVETEFPEATGAVDLQSAYSQLLARYPLQKEYRLVTEESSDRTIPGEDDSELVAKLTYRLQSAPSTRFTPDQLLPIDYSGKEIPAEQTVVPTDVATSSARADIIFLAKVGVIKLDNGRYYPEREITVGEWLELLSRAAGWSTDDPIVVLPGWAKAAADKPYAGAAQAAIAAGLILPGESVDMSKILTREQLAVFAVRALGYEKVASIPGIYQLNCRDAAQVTPARLGHVAIARGLGILVGGKDVYQPQATASRATCATILMRMLRLER